MSRNPSQVLAAFRTTTDPILPSPESQEAAPARDVRKAKPPLRRFLYENGLSLVLLVMFLATWAAQSVVGWHVYNEQQKEHNESPVDYGEYLRTGHFIESTAENWESEFLQMGVFVLLTVWLRQKGSAESKKLDEAEEVDRDPTPSKHKPDAPWPVRKGGAWLWLYSNSLSLAFVALFLFCFFAHAAGGAKEYSEEQMAHGRPGVSMLGYLGTSQFWYESLQNWQSEFLAIGAMVVLTIWLRQKGSHQSKPVDAPHHQTDG